MVDILAHILAELGGGGGGKPCIDYLYLIDRALPA